MRLEKPRKGEKGGDRKKSRIGIVWKWVRETIPPRKSGRHCRWSLNRFLDKGAEKEGGGRPQRDESAIGSTFVAVENEGEKTRQFGGVRLIRVPLGHLGTGKGLR